MLCQVCWVPLIMMGVGGAMGSLGTQPPILDVIRDLLPSDASQISPKCAIQMGEYAANFGMNVDSWALRMLDATSKIPSGLLSMNFAEMGNFDQCIAISTDQTQTGHILGKYCLGFVQFVPPSSSSDPAKVFRMRSDSLGNLEALSKTTRAQGPTWAICLPNGCNTTDVNILVNALMIKILGPVEGLVIGYSDLFCQTSEDVNKPLSGGAIATITILLILLMLVVVSTLYDLYCYQYRKERPHELLVAFSVYSNGQKVFRMTRAGPEQMPCLDGLKFYSMIWVVAAHTYSIPGGGPITNTNYLIEWANNTYSMFLVSGTLSVDTFFVVGGALMAYGFLKAKTKKIPFNLFIYYVHRYIRLTPPLAMVVLVSSTLISYMSSGPKWPLVYLYFQRNCEDYWWSALLYVQNYVNIRTMCIGQTWYLSIDMQLYLLSPIFFMILWRWPKSALCLLSFAVLAFCGSSFYVAWIHHLTAILTNFYGNADDYSNEYYLLTHTRAGPWFIGVILGYYLFKIKKNETKFRLNKLVIFLVWGATLATLLACVLGGFDTLRGKEYDKWGNAFHIALVRPCWSLAIASIILMCTRNYGGPINWILSLPIYQVFNRFMYSVYLTHVTMLYMMTFAKKTPDYFGDFHMAYQFWGTLWMSMGMATLLVFGVESPMIVLEKVLLGNISGRARDTKTKGAEDARSDCERGTTNSAFEKY